MQYSTWMGRCNLDNIIWYSSQSPDASLSLQVHRSLLHLAIRPVLAFSDFISEQQAHALCAPRFGHDDLVRRVFEHPDVLAKVHVGRLQGRIAVEQSEQQFDRRGMRQVEDL